MDQTKKLISVVTPCYNEEGNVEELYRRVKKVFDEGHPQYRYEHVFIDNASRDNTVQVLKRLAQADRSVKIIVNVRNFGHIRSPFYALLQTHGDATILMAADLQDPPELLPELIQKWEGGSKIALGVKNQSEESPLMFAIRKMYYDFIARVSDIELVKNATGFGLYDRDVIDKLREVADPYPYFRGLIAELGYDRAIVHFTQPTRKRGISSNNFYTLYDIAMLGITNHSKVPLRVAAMLGFLLSILSLLVAIGYFIYKLVFWEHFSVGVAPMVIGVFFFSSVQLFFIGIIGEYIGSIYTQVLKRPLVIERERVNF
jgi:glycosyltransferase involved in cell wall biosynthesis